MVLIFTGGKKVAIWSFRNNFNNLSQMGNSENRARQANLRDFPMQKYLGQGLNQNQILQIKEAFDSY